MDASSPALKRELGVFGAMMMGLGSIVGTGVFVSIGIAAGVAGPSVILAIAIAALVALCNALSSAQLAAAHAVSGGTYEYGYKYLHPVLGLTAGWMFLCAKSASAATAALGFAGYLLHALPGESWHASWLVPIAIAATVALTLVVLSGLRRSNLTNIVIVSITVATLLSFILGGLPTAFENAPRHLDEFFTSPAQPEAHPLRQLLHAAALMFVAYTGYGRIATLGEEVREPRRTIPRAIITTLIVSALLYMAVGGVAIAAIGAAALAETTTRQAAPLETVAAAYGLPVIPWLVAVGAITAMLGVLLNLILGLSRVLLAMGRRGDAPKIVARVSERHTTPYVAVIVVGLLITSLAAIGSVKTTWTFSAFTVLVYYAITNLAALKLPPDDRLFPSAFAWCGLAGCLFLAFWVPWHIWAAGLALIAAGLLWHLGRQTKAPDR